MVVGRLFPSSKQFLVVSPDPIVRSPASYGPPTIISVSPNNLWLFAFFPSHETDGIACLWNNAPCLDAWKVKEYWSLPRGAGVLTCAWAGAEREVRLLLIPLQTSFVIYLEQWSIYAEGSSFRLPSRGPLTPVSSPTLLLVTQAHQFHVCYLRTHLPSLKMLSCPLNQPYLATEGQPLAALHDTTTGPKTSRLCTHAAIGFIYGGKYLPF